MTINIINQYVGIVRKQMTTYMKMIFGKDFNKQYNDSFLDKYINTRYYNYYENTLEKTVRKKILYQINEVEEDICIGNVKDRELIQNMSKFFQYVIYLDDVVAYKDFGSIIEKINKLRKKLLKKEKEDFENNLYEKMIDFMNQKKELINRFDTDEFSLKLTNYPNRINLFRVKLMHHIEFPPEFSEYGVNRAFNTGVISEDKLLVEYYLITIQVLKDILKQDFKKQYIVEFTETILKKAKKLKSTLNIIDNVGVQDKVSLKIRYEQFLANKKKIFEILKGGYRIAIIIDDSFEVNNKNIETLKMFKYVILNKELKTYSDIIKNRSELQNIIEI